MKKNILYTTVVLIFCVVLYVIFNVAVYFYNQYKNSQMKDLCHSSKATFIMATEEFDDPNGCYAKMFDLIVPHFLVYDVKLKDFPNLSYKKVNKQAIYYIPSFIPQYTEAMISYGIGRTCRFEDEYSEEYNKPVYAFDCGNLTNICKKAIFEPQCVGTCKNATSYTLKGHITGHPKVDKSQIHEYGKKIEELGLSNKPIYLKMNIIGAEDKVIEDILKNSDNIAAISLYVHFKNPELMVKKIKTLSLLEENFVLVAQDTVPILANKIAIKPPFFSDKYVKGYWSRQYTLTYINKNLIKNSHISFNQNNINNRNGIAISWVVILAEILKHYLQNF